MEKITICERCKHMVSSRDIICPYCGKKLRQDKKDKPDRQVRQDKQDKRVRKGSNLLYIIALAPLILVMSGVCGFYLLSGDDKPEWLMDWNSSHPDIPAVSDMPDMPSEPDTPSEPDDAGTETMPEPTAEPIPEPTPEPTAEPTPEPTEEPGPTPEPTVRQVYSQPDEYGRRGKTPPVFTEYTSSSAAEDVYSALRAFDKSMDNVWGTGGENGGINEWIMMSSDEYQAVSGVRIFNGNTQSEEAFNNNARVKIVELSFSDGRYEKRILQDGFSRNEPYIIRLGETVNTKYIRVTILDKYGTSDMVCIGEIEVF